MGAEIGFRPIGGHAKTHRGSRPLAVAYDVLSNANAFNPRRRVEMNVGSWSELCLGVSYAVERLSPAARARQNGPKTSSQLLVAQDTKNRTDILLQNSVRPSQTVTHNARSHHLLVPYRAS